MAELSRGTLFDATLVSDLINKTKGKSSLAVLSQQEPIPFNGMKEFIFSMDSEVDVVAENGKKTHGGVSLEPVKIIPIKVEYGARVSDEFLFASQEEKINILKAFNDGFAKKLAKGIDLVAFHGVNPRTGTASAVIGTNNFDSKVTQKVVFKKETAEDNLEAAIAMVQGSEREVTGMVFSTDVTSALAAIKVNGVRQYPELRFGANPGTLGGMKMDINKTIKSTTSNDVGIVGDFESMFKWGYAKEVLFDVIQYGDPDNSGKDLKGYNQVYLRAEAYVGWGILDGDSFARLTTV
jgi:hypothetical protein